MRLSLGIILAAALTLCAGLPAFAADGADTNAPCVDVQVGNERVPDYDCINRQFRLQADRAHTGPVPEAPIDTHSSSPATGAANQAAAQQMMGDAFGKSAKAQRPTPVFVPALPNTGAH